MDNYPPGAANDPRAPYNQVEPDEVKFNVELTHTFTLRTSVISTEYEEGDFNEDGYHDPPTYTGNAAEEFQEQYVPLKEVLKRCQLMLMSARETNYMFTTDIKQRAKKDQYYAGMIRTIFEYLWADEEFENV